MLLLALLTGGCSSAPSGYSLTLHGLLNAQNGQVGFVSPTVSTIEVATSDIVGKPYLVASFPAGFSPGNDPALDSKWGTVPDSLKIDWTTPATYQNGAYDLVLVVYRTTEITAAIKAQPANQAPAAKNGDLATFTMDMTVVRPGDAAIPPGVVRLNVDGQDASITAQNHVITDPNDTDQLKAAFVDTIMIVP
jgi:hypothetical protein